MQTEIRDTFGKRMTPEALKRFTDLKQQNQLLSPDYVAKFYGNLVVRGIAKEINGKYLRYSDPELKNYEN